MLCLYQVAMFMGSYSTVQWSSKGPIPRADQITKNEPAIKKNWTLGPGPI